MNSAALLAGLIGALIGSLTSITTMILQNRFQNRRDAAKLLFETAFKDYELRILRLPQNRAAFPVILAYHQRMFELTESGKLTPDAMKGVFDLQSEMAAAVEGAVADHGTSVKPPPSSSRPKARRSRPRTARARIARH